MPEREPLTTSSGQNKPPQPPGPEGPPRRSQGSFAEQFASGAPITEAPRWTGRWPGWLLLWAGWLIPQLVLLGPALIGRTVDLPVDLLVFDSICLPESKDSPPVVVGHGVELSDLIFGYPEAREFSAREFRAGRLPLWYPYDYAGMPFQWGKYSPFEILYYFAPSPITVAWIWLAQSLTVGLGMWFLLRHSLNLSYGSAALASWCAPLTGFMTLWHGFSTVPPTCWLPWMFVAIDAAVKNPRGWGSVGVAVLTVLVLVAGHIGIAGLVLLTSGFYAIWLLGQAAWQKGWRGTIFSAVGIGFGWLLGFAISAPQLLPQLEYSRTGARIESHSEGLEERPPEGFEALPAILRPDVYGGRTRANWARTVNSGLIESSSSGYAGLLATLWLAPLAWRDRRRRSLTIFLTLLIVLSLGWTLAVPGIVDFLRSEPMRPLISLSYNRWVFATGNAILILAAVGLDSLRTSLPRFRWWWGVPTLATAIALVWFLYRLGTLSRKLDDLGLSSGLLIGAGLCLVALLAWGVTFRSGPRSWWIRAAVVCILPLELFGFAWDERRQADMSLYFPRVPVLEQLAALPQGRVWGVKCLPPSINQFFGLEEVRGYDAVDPGKFVKLFELACDRESTFYYSYARTLMATPDGRVVDHVLKLHPVADLLNVRYVIFRQPPRSDLKFRLKQDDYWIIENEDALPRTFVPISAQVVKSDEEALLEMSPFEFDPRQTVFMTDDLGLPEKMHGQASVHYETPTRLRLEVDMQTAGLVLLSDLWDKGWRAELDGTPCPIYRVDVALRGFQVPLGKHMIVCTYDPASVRFGFGIAAAACALLAIWSISKGIVGRRARFSGAAR